MNLKKILPLIGIIILVIILFTIDFQKIFDIFSRLNPLYAFLSFFIIFPLIILANIEWQLLLRKQKIKVSFWYSIKNFFIGYFYGFITPGGFGAYTRSIYLSNESGAPLPKCVSNIIIFNTVEFMAMLFVGAFGAIYLSQLYPYLFYTIIALMILSIGLFLFFFKKERSKVLFTKIVQSRIFATVKDKVEGSIDTFYEDLPRLKDVIPPFIISITGWAIKYVLLFFIAKMFSINIHFIDFIFIMAVADVIAAIPISIYGLGTREAALIGMFAAFGVAKEPIVSLSLYWFVLIWLTPSIIGVFVTMFETKKFDEIVLDDLAIAQFEKYIKKFPELYRHLADIVKKKIPKSVKKPVIIDLGCGPGILSQKISEKIPSAKIIAIDPSTKMLEFANKNNRDNKNFETRIGSSEKIPVSNNSADIVVIRFSITYWKNPRKSFAEINRILKPKGRVVLEFLNKDFPKWQLFLTKIRMHLRFPGFNEVRYHISAYQTAYKTHSVKKLFSISGFKIIYEEGKKKDWKNIIVGQKK